MALIPFEESASLHGIDGESYLSGDKPLQSGDNGRLSGDKHCLCGDKP